MTGENCRTSKLVKLVNLLRPVKQVKLAKPVKHDEVMK